MQHKKVLDLTGPEDPCEISAGEADNDRSVDPSADVSRSRIGLHEVAHAGSSEPQLASTPAQPDHFTN
jgi:hypothetical protein